MLLFGCFLVVFLLVFFGCAFLCGFLRIALLGFAFFSCLLLCGRRALLSLCFTFFLSEGRHRQGHHHYKRQNKSQHSLHTESPLISVSVAVIAAQRASK